MERSSLQVRGKRISLSKAAKSGEGKSETGEMWPRFDKAFPASPPRPGKKADKDFVSFEQGREEHAEFIPLEGIENGVGTKNNVEGVLEKVRKETASIEEEAYEKGFIQGEKDGRELGEKKVIKSVENIEKILLEIGHLKKEILKQSEKEILELIFSIAQKIIHRKIEEDETIIRDAVLEAMQAVTEKSQIVIKINPEDFDSVEKLKPSFFNLFKEMKSIEIKPDQSVSRGGCFLETPYGDVDASVEARLDKVQQCLNRAFLVKGGE